MNNREDHLKIWEAAVKSKEEMNKKPSKENFMSKAPNGKTYYNSPNNPKSKLGKEDHNK